MQPLLYPELPGTSGLRCRRLRVQEREMFGDTCHVLTIEDLPAAADAFPQRYTPIMSSTVGVGITINATGFDVTESLVSWNATYGKFLSWGTNLTVTDLGNPATNHGERLYWSFTKKPASIIRSGYRYRESNRSS